MRTPVLSHLQRSFAWVFASLVLILSAVPAQAQVAPPLGTAERFSVLGNSGVTGSTGAGTTVNGDVGSSPNPAVTNFPPSTVLAPFVLHTTNDLIVQQAHTDAIAAYNFLAAQGPGTVLPAQLDTAILTSGIYSFAGGAADLAATGTLTLNGPGIFIFQVDSTLTANVDSNIIGTADPCNVFWRVGTSATLNGVTFMGTVIADASITVGSGSNVTGRLLAGTGPTGAVTMAGAGGNTIGGCAVPTGLPCPAITVDPATLPNATIGVAYSATISATGGSGSYTFALTGTLPAGLTLNPTTGVISGTPTTAGTSNFTVTATDTATGCFGSRDYEIATSCPVITVNPTTLPGATVGITYNATISATGGSGPYTFALTGTLPAGLTLNPTTGVISGVPTTSGTSNFTITATSIATGCAGNRAYLMTTAAPAPVVTVAVPTLDFLGLAVLFIVLASAGVFIMGRF